MMNNLINKSLTDIDKYIIRFKIISNSLEMLSEATVMDNQSKYGLTVFVRYSVIELKNFIKYHEEFLKIIDPKRKNLILDLDPFLKEIFKHKSTIKYDRDNWVAHIREGKRNMIDNTTTRNDILLDDYYRMVLGTHEFLEGIKGIFFKEWEKLSVLLSKDEEQIFRKLRINKEIFQQGNRERLRLVNKKLALDNAGFQIHMEFES